MLTYMSSLRDFEIIVSFFTINIPSLTGLNSEVSLFQSKSHKDDKYIESSIFINFKFHRNDMDIAI